MNAGGGTSSTGMAYSHKATAGSIMEHYELFDWRAIGAQSIDRRRVVAIAQRQTAKQHQGRIDAQEFHHFFVPNGPRFLRAGLQSLLARQQHQVLDEHAEVGPLRWSHDAVEEKKHPDRRTEEIVVLRELAMPGRLVIAPHADERVQVLAVLVASRAIRFLQFGRIHMIFRAA